MRHLLGFSLKQHSFWNAVRQSWINSADLVNRQKSSALMRRPHTPGINDCFSKGNWGFGLRPWLHFRTPIHMIKDLPVKECYLSWPWANFFTALLCWQMPTNLTWIKGSGFLNQSYFWSNTADLKGPGGKQEILLNPLLWLTKILFDANSKRHLIKSVSMVDFCLVRETGVWFPACKPGSPHRQ